MTDDQLYSLHNNFEMILYSPAPLNSSLRLTGMSQYSSATSMIQSERLGSASVLMILIVAFEPCLTNAVMSCSENRRM